MAERFTLRQREASKHNGRQDADWRPSRNKPGGDQSDFKPLTCPTLGSLAWLRGCFAMMVTRRIDRRPMQKEKTTGQTFLKYRSRLISDYADFFQIDPASVTV